MYFVYFTRYVSFTEICLLNNTKRVASVRAETFCNLFSLSVRHFKSVLDYYPTVRATMERVADVRLQEIGQSTPALSHREILEQDDLETSLEDKGHLVRSFDTVSRDGKDDADQLKPCQQSHQFRRNQSGSSAATHRKIDKVKNDLKLSLPSLYLNDMCLTSDVERAGRAVNPPGEDRTNEEGPAQSSRRS